LDSWWVKVNEESIPDHQTLEQAKAHKPPRSRAKVIVLHTSLSDEWIPIRELETLIACHANDLEMEQMRNEEIEEELSQLKKDFPSTIENMISWRGLTSHPTEEQREEIFFEVAKRLRQSEEFEVEKAIMKVCHERFEPVALKVADDDEYGELLSLHESFSSSSNFEFLLLYDSEDRMITIDEVLNTPTLDQLFLAVKSLSPKCISDWRGDSESECPSNRKLAKKLAKLFPELVKNTPEADRFYNPQPKGKNTIASNKPPSLPNRSKTKKIKRKSIITFSRIVFMLTVLAIVLLVSKCLR
jgi:hypothetical protein